MTRWLSSKRQQLDSQRKLLKRANKCCEFSNFQAKRCVEGKKALTSCLNTDFYSLFNQQTRNVSNAALGLDTVWEWELFFCTGNVFVLPVGWSLRYENKKNGRRFFNVGVRKRCWFQWLRTFGRPSDGHTNKGFRTGRSNTDQNLQESLRLLLLL